MNRIRESRYDPSPCLNCGEPLDACANIHDRTPEDAFADGSAPISICALCGHVMALTADLKHRELIDTEIVELAGNKELLMLLDVAAKVRAKRARIMADIERLKQREIESGDRDKWEATQPGWRLERILREEAERRAQAEK